MSRYIDADALIDNLELMYEHRDSKDEPYNIGVRGAINMTRKAPTIEPKRGEWVPFEYGDDTWHKCSVCGTADKYIDKVPRPDGTIGTLIAVRNFCPNCGADMRKESE